MKIALIADIDTVNFFKLGGMEYTYVVENPDKAAHVLRELTENPEITILITTDNIAHKNRSLVNEIIEEHEFPIIISIPTLGGASQLKVDTITELIKRKIGIELKSE